MESVEVEQEGEERIEEELSSVQWCEDRGRCLGACDRLQCLAPMHPVRQVQKPAALNGQHWLPAM